MECWTFVICDDVVLVKIKSKNYLKEILKNPFFHYSNAPVMSIANNLTLES